LAPHYTSRCYKIDKIREIHCRADKIYELILSKHNKRTQYTLNTLSIITDAHRFSQRLPLPLYLPSLTRLVSQHTQPHANAAACRVLCGCGRRFRLLETYEIQPIPYSYPKLYFLKARAIALFVQDGVMTHNKI
jgi:hypothetical protein